MLIELPSILSTIYLDHDVLLCDTICCTNSQHLIAIDNVCSAVTTGLSDANTSFSCESKPRKKVGMSFAK